MSIGSGERIEQGGLSAVVALEPHEYRHSCEMTNSTSFRFVLRDGKHVLQQWCGCMTCRKGVWNDVPSVGDETTQPSSNP